MISAIKVPMENLTFLEDDLREDIFFYPSILIQIFKLSESQEIH